MSQECHRPLSSTCESTFVMKPKDRYTLFSILLGNDQGLIARLLGGGVRLYSADRKRDVTAQMGYPIWRVGGSWEKRAKDLDMTPEALAAHMVSMLESPELKA